MLSRNCFIPTLVLMQNIKVLFGDILKAELSKRSWSQSYFADRIKTSRSNLSLWISGKTSPHLEMIGVIAKELNMQPYELITPREKIAQVYQIGAEDALLRVIEELGYQRPKRLRKADK